MRDDTKFLIVGAGGTGGAIAAYLGRAGHHVTLIARGDHQRVMAKEGVTLIVEQSDDEYTEEVITGIRAMTAEDYMGLGEVPDVVFVCTKSYSVHDIAPLLDAVSDEHTLIIPTLNGIRMGEYVRRYVHRGRVIDGCIYINGIKEAPGRIRMKGPLFRIVFGSEGILADEEGQALAEMINETGIRAIYSTHILRDTIRKFAYVSPAGITCLYWNCRVGAMQHEGPERTLFCDLISDIVDLGSAMGVKFNVDLIETNLNILDHLLPELGTSMQRDVDAGRDNEMEVQILEPIRMGEAYGVPMEHYRAAADKLGLMN